MNYLWDFDDLVSSDATSLAIDQSRAIEAGRDDKTQNWSWDKEKTLSDKNIIFASEW